MDLVIGVGFIFTDDLTELAKEYPNVAFAGVDYALTTDAAGNVVQPPPNLAALKFREEEGSFLVGALAALVGNSKRVGFVGGMDIPLIHKFEAGYRAGALHVCPDCTVIAQYAGATPEAFRNPGKGKELDRRLRAYCADKTCDDVEKAFNHARISCTRVFNARDQYHDGHYAAREMTVPVVDHQSGVPIRVYVPYGHPCLPYGPRDLRARPESLLWLLRDLAGRPRLPATLTALRQRAMLAGGHGRLPR